MMPVTVEQVRPWVALGVGVTLVGAGIVLMNPAYIALGAGAIGLKGATGHEE